MRDREEIENDVQMDTEIRGASLINQALIIEVLLDIRKSVNPPSIGFGIEISETKEKK